jgi:hypothetical protein
VSITINSNRAKRLDNSGSAPQGSSSNSTRGAALSSSETSGGSPLEHSRSRRCQRQLPRRRQSEHARRGRALCATPDRPLAAMERRNDGLVNHRPREALLPSTILLDIAGRRRSPATLPAFHAGRPPHNKGLSSADGPCTQPVSQRARARGKDRRPQLRTRVRAKEPQRVGDGPLARATLRATDPRASATSDEPFVSIGKRVSS